MSSSPPPAETLESRNPATGALIRTYAEFSDEEIENALSELHRTFTQTGWSSATSAPIIAARSAFAEHVGTILLEQVDGLAQLVSDEMGKPVAEAAGEVKKSAGLCLYYSKHAAEFLQAKEMPPLPGTKRAFYMYEPLGVIYSIMPWNFPIWQVIRMAIPVMLGGNCVVLKHSPNVIMCALKCEEIMAEAMRRSMGKFQEAEGPSSPLVPENMVAFRTLAITAAKSSRVLEHPFVRGVSLTGSERAGRAVASQAGALLKKCVVELGGNDAYVILKDADVDRAVSEVVKGRLLNAGQSCIGPKRVICEGKEVKEEFERKLVAKVKEALGGDADGEEGGRGGLGSKTLVHGRAAAEVQEKVEKSIQSGAKCIFQSSGGGAASTATGGTATAAAPVTILTDIAPDNPAFDQEIFGPVFGIIQADDYQEEICPCPEKDKFPVHNDEKHAIALHNDSSFGLGGAVFSKDEKRALEIAETQLHTGMCWVNAFVKSDASLPFGGTRNSGLGRECGSFGMLEFMNVKTVVVAE
eukprot:g2030.t1